MKPTSYLAVSVLSWMVAAALAVSNAASAASQPRHYSENGLEFDYDPRLTLDTEKKDQSSTINLKLGKHAADLVLTIQVVDQPLSGDAYAASAVQAMHTGLEKAGWKVGEIQPAKATIGKEERTGKQFNYSLPHLSVDLVYQAYGWDLSTGDLNRKIQFIGIQYSRKREAAVRPIIETTLRSWQYKKP